MSRKEELYVLIKCPPNADIGAEADDEIRDYGAEEIVGEYDVIRKEAIGRYEDPEGFDRTIKKIQQSQHEELDGLSDKKKWPILDKLEPMDSILELIACGTKDDAASTAAWLRKAASVAEDYAAELNSGSIFLDCETGSTLVTDDILEKVFEDGIDTDDVDAVDEWVEGNDHWWLVPYVKL